MSETKCSIDMKGGAVSIEEILTILDKVFDLALNPTDLKSIRMQLETVIQHDEVAASREGLEDLHLKVAKYSHRFSRSDISSQQKPVEDGLHLIITADFVKMELSGSPTSHT